MGEDDAQTGVAPTELGAAIDETEAHTAWSLDDAPDDEPPRLTPGRITALAVGTALALIAGAGSLAALQFREKPDAVPTPPSAASTTSNAALTPWIAPPPAASQPPPATVTVIQPPPVTRTVAAPPPPVKWTAAHDYQLVDTLVAYGWSVWDPVNIAAQARQVCTVLQQGGTPQSVVAELSAPGGAPTTRTEAEVFVNAAMTTYPNCP